MPPHIHVVAGILFNEHGEFLLSSRPQGKPYAGYWEFAGGKVEAGETEFAALQREFAEELGIEIVSATPWLAKFYVYEHAHVYLRFFRVAAHEWHGTLQARERQQWAWQRAGDLTVSPMLPANTAVLNAFAPYHLAEATHEPVLLTFETLQRMGHLPHTRSIWVVVDSLAQFRAAWDADVFVWRVADDAAAQVLNQTLVDGVAQPLLVCATATLCAKWATKWWANGAQAVLLDDETEWV